MKKIIFILLILSAFSTTKAQTYQSIFTKNTTFNILISQSDINWSNDSVFAIKDTVINNHIYIKYTNWSTMTLSPFAPDFQTDYYFLREDTTIGKTYGFDINLNKEYLLMDLSLNVGDTFWVPNFDKINGDSVAFKVDSVIYISGKKIIIFKDNLFTNGIQSIYKIKFIEGIGPSNGLIAYKRNIPGYPNYQMRYCMYLLCSHDNTNQTIQYTLLGCKVNGVGINEFDAKEKIRLKVYPNPASVYASFIWNLPLLKSTAEIRIFDANAKIITQKTINTKLGQWVWDTRAIKNGVYYYEVLSENQQLSNGKIIINN